MHYKTGSPRGEFILFNTLEESIAADNPVRLIDLLVEKLYEHQPSHFEYKGKSLHGQKAYHPILFMKLYLYGYLNRIASSRRLEAETYRNIEVKWLLCDMHPDHKTIADYRKDNKQAIRQVTLDFRRLLIREGYIDGHKIIYDGSKIKACTSTDKVISITRLGLRLENLEKQLDSYLEQLSGNDKVEEVREDLSTLSMELGVEQSLLEKISSLQARIAELESIQSQMKSKDMANYCPTDPEAHLMKSRDGYIPAYNLQAGVDSKYKMIAFAEVSDQANDIQLLEENYNTTVEQTGLEPELVIADTGYGNLQQIEHIESTTPGLCVIPLAEHASKQKDKKNGISFTCDEQGDTYRCVKGNLLVYKGNTTHSNTSYRIYRADKQQCLVCPLRSKCTGSKSGRAIKIPENQKFKDEYNKRMRTAEMKKLTKERKTLIEHVFGTLKRWMGKIPVLLTGKKKVQIEIDLYATAYNLRRLFSIESVPNLLRQIEKYAC